MPIIVPIILNEPVIATDVVAYSVAGIGLFLSFIIKGIYCMSFKTKFSDIYKLKTAAIPEVLSGFSLVLSASSKNLRIAIASFKMEIIMLIFIAVLFVILIDFLVKLDNIPSNKILKLLSYGKDLDARSIISLSGSLYDASNQFVNYFKWIISDRNEKRGKLLLNLLANLHFEKILINYNPDNSYPDYFKFSVDTNNYLRFLEIFFKSLDKKLLLRVFSLYQPYEWFHNYLREGAITFYEEMDHYMNICSNNLRNKKNFERFILSHSSLIEIQKELFIKIDRSDSPRKFTFSNLSKNENNERIVKGCFQKNFPFHNDAEYYGPDDFYYIFKKGYTPREKNISDREKSLIKRNKDNLDEEEMEFVSLFNIFNYGKTKLICDNDNYLECGLHRKACFHGELNQSWSKIVQMVNEILNKTISNKEEEKEEIIEDLTLIESNKEPIIAFLTKIREGPIPDTVVFILSQGSLREISCFFKNLGEISPKVELPTY